MTDEQTAAKRWRRAQLIKYMVLLKKPLILGLIVVFAATVLDLIAPRIIAHILDHEIIPEVGIADTDKFIKLMALYLVTVMISGAFRYLGRIFFSRAAGGAVREIQTDVFTHVQSLPVSYFDSMPAGKVVSRITNDTNAIYTLFMTALSQVLMSIINAVGIYISLSFLDYRLFLLSLLPLPVILAAMVRFKRRQEAITADYRRTVAEINGQINESIQGVEVIQALNRTDKIKGEFAETNKKAYGLGKQLVKLHTRNTWNLITLIQMATTVFFLLYFGVGKISKTYFVPVGSIYVFLSYMELFFSRMINIINRLGSIAHANSAADHLFELMREEKVTEVDGEVDSIRGKVSFKDISFAYKDDYVLQDVSFTVEAGQKVAFVGSTGSGKSTIMNLLMGLYEPQKGQIEIDDKPFEDYAIRALRRHMAMVLQDPYLFTGTILSNITLDNPDISRETAIQAFKEVGGEEFLCRWENGIDTVIREKGSSLSTGEKQLISFARALAQEPSILVLDEATANIDSETERIIQEGISRLEKGRTTFIIAHRLSTVSDADTIYVLDHGRIVETGTESELLALGGLYAEMSAKGVRNGV